MANSMVKEFILILMELKKKENGVKERELIGIIITMIDYKY